MTTPGQTVGQRVRLARTARGYGVNELDRLIGSKQGYVSRLEGSDREPRADTLRKLAQALGVSVEWLATGEGAAEGGAAAGATGLTPVPGSVVVYDDDDPYPNRSRAVALLGHNLDPRARAVLLSYRFRSGGGRDEDLSLELWLDEAKNLQRQVRRLDREFAAIELEGRAPAGGAPESTGWTPLPVAPPPAGDAPAPPPERLHHARVRHRDKRTPAALSPTPGALGAAAPPAVGDATGPGREPAGRPRSPPRRRRATA